MVKQQPGPVGHPHVPQGDACGDDQHRPLAAGQGVAVEADSQLDPAEEHNHAPAEETA
jgi:hypothetical protein